VSDANRTSLTGKAPSRRASALPELYARHKDELTAYARRRVGRGPPEPDDLVQQAFANFAGVQNPDQVRNPRAFLYRVVSNLIVDHFRNAPPGPGLNVHDANDEDALVGYTESRPEIVLLDHERFEEVAAAIRALPQRQRRFLLLNRLEGMPYTEIARRNGVSHMTAKRDVEAAIIACQRAMSERGLDDD
jgi:RNA polymerase sigma-70 factor (ECF subfamily)